MPYAYSWYLDIVSEGKWDALIINDYAAVFPLPYKKRLWWRSCYQPLFTQQLGLFYTSSALAELLPDVLAAIPTAFRNIHLHLNTQNTLAEHPLKNGERVTHHIALDKPYQSLTDAYNDQTKRNLKRSQSHQLQVMQLHDPEILIGLRKKHLAEVLQGKQSESDTQRLKKLITAILSHKKGNLLAALGPQGDVQAIVCLINSNGYLIYLSSVSSDIGKAQHAMTYLIDHILKSNATSNKTFDFEGSMIPGVARYFKGFGGEEKWFTVLKK